MRRVVLVIVAFVLALSSTSHAADDWAPLSFLIGDWGDCTGSGAPGASTGRFSVEPQVGGRALLRRNTADTPQGRHEDLMLIYRTPGQGFRATYVDNEDHVIQYTITPMADPAGAVFLSDETPGTPRFRLTYQMKADGHIGVVFAIAPPGGGDFKTYTEGSCKRR
jgi:hypothetical protein